MMKNKKIMIIAMAACFLIGCKKNETSNNSSETSQNGDKKYDITYSQGESEGSSLNIALSPNIEYLKKYEDDSQPKTRKVEWKGKTYEVEYFMTSDSVVYGIEHVYMSKEAIITLDNNDNVIVISVLPPEDTNKEIKKLDNDEYKKIALDYIGDTVDIDGYECEVEPYSGEKGTASVFICRKYNDVSVEDGLELVINKYGEVQTYSNRKLHSFDDITEEDFIESNLSSDDVIEQVENEVKQFYKEEDIVISVSRQDIFISSDGKISKDISMRIKCKNDEHFHHAIVTAS